MRLQKPKTNETPLQWIGFASYGLVPGFFVDRSGVPPNPEPGVETKGVLPELVSAGVPPDELFGDRSGRLGSGGLDCPPPGKPLVELVFLSGDEDSCPAVNMSFDIWNIESLEARMAMDAAITDKTTVSAAAHICRFRSLVCSAARSAVCIISSTRLSRSRASVR